jgi:hypothetical protein
MSNCKCSGKDNNFDAKLAYESLLHKNTQLIELVAEYMMEAGLDRTERVSNAMDLAEMLLRIIGGIETSDFTDCAFLNTNTGFCTGCFSASSDCFDRRALSRSRYSPGIIKLHKIRRPEY